MTAKTKAKPAILPQWFTEGVVDRFRAGICSVFVLHGDITCLVPNPYADVELKWPYIPLQELFSRVFDERKMVIFYNIAIGMRFLTSEMETEFRKVAEIAGDEDASPKDPVAAAKAGLAAKRQLPREPELCLPLIEKVLRKMDSVALIIESAHFIAPESAQGMLLQNERTHIARLRAWAQDARVKKRSNIVLMLTDLATKMSGEFRQSASRIATVFIPKPSPEERRLYIERLSKGTPEEQQVEQELIELKNKFSKLKAGSSLTEVEKEIEELEERQKLFPPHFDIPKDFDIDVFVNATQGMSLRQILEVFRAANQAKRPIDLFFVKEKKRDILNAEYGDVMEIADPQWSLDEIGGLKKQKAYFASVIEAIRKGEIRLIPQGITIMGPPGTGKTALLEALAKGARYNFVKMKNARSMWVGMSEERTERQIQGLWALAPVIVMNDEADLGEANRDAPKGDSGVSERIMQAWMRFLSEPRIRGQVVMVNCTNRPDRMDAAMKRSGRSDDRIAILMPAEEERSAIFEVMYRRYNIPTTITDFTPFAERTKGLSGADIEAITLKSFRFAGEMKKDEVDDEALYEAIADFIPPASQAEIDLMTLLAISESSSRRLLPANVKDIVEEIKERRRVPGLAELIAQIESRGILTFFEAVPVV